MSQLFVKLMTSSGIRIGKPQLMVMRSKLLTDRTNVCGVEMLRTTVRNTTTATDTKLSEQHKTEWNTIYRLPLVRWAATFNRLKIYQGSFTMLGLPLAMALEQTGQIPEHTTAIFGAIGGSVVLTLALCSIFVKDLIGFIYINSAGDQLKFAYVDYWGRRRETIVAIDDIKPLSEVANPIQLDFYRNVCINDDSKRSYKLLNNYGVIVEPDVYHEYFSN